MNFVDDYYFEQPICLNDISTVLNPVTGIDFKDNAETLASIATYLGIFPDDDPIKAIDWKIFLVKKRNMANDYLIGLTGWYILEDEPDVAWLGWFGVIKEFQHKGIGTSLLNRTMRVVCRKHNSKEMRVYCLEEIVPFYTKNGFKLLGQSKNIGMENKTSNPTDYVLSFKF